MRNRIHRQNGSFFVEAICGFALLIPLILALCDLYTVFWAINLNDSLCREAGRVTAMANPCNQKECLKRARAIVAGANKSQSEKLCSFELTEVKISPSQDKLRAQLDSLVNCGGTVVATITTSTTAEVRPIFFRGHLKFTSQQSFPCTYSVSPTTMLNSSQGCWP